MDLDRREEKYLKYIHRKGPDYVYPYFWSEIHTDQYVVFKSLLRKDLIAFNADVEAAQLKAGNCRGRLDLTELEVRFKLTDLGRDYLDFVAARDGNWKNFLKKALSTLAILALMAGLIWAAK